MMKTAPPPVVFGGIRGKLISAILRVWDVRINHSRLPVGTKIRAPLQLGYHSNINGPALIKGSAPVHIGNFNAFGSDIRIISSNHPENILCNQQALLTGLGLSRPRPESTGVRIGSDIWIGDLVIILPGVSIGDGAIVGAGSVVTRDVAPFTVVAGVPATPIGVRFREDVINLLVKIQWWNLDLTSLEKLKYIFKYDNEDELAHNLQRAHDSLTKNI